MLRSALLVSTLFLAACATSRTSEQLVSDVTEVHASSAPTVLVTPPEVWAAPDAASALAPASTETLLVSEATPGALALVPAAQESLHSSRFTLKGGYYGSDEDALDDGYIFNVSWMKFMSKLLALELEVGYFDVDGSDSGVDLDVWSVPIMLNGRVNVPIWVLDVYGGLGVGGFYYDAEASGALSADDDGFLFGGDAFLGATINLADAIALGLEAKYYVSEDADDVDSSLDAFALMLTVGFSN
jgi:outer membrane protein with beta-barrel domain